MTAAQQGFLDILKACLQNEKPEDPKLDPEGWAELVRMAAIHSLLPYVLDAVFTLPSFSALDLKQKTAWRDKALEAVTRQVFQENEFLDLILSMQRKGLDPVVLKGAVCRALYPKPFLRPSVDEDLLIPPDQICAYHDVLCENGVLPDKPDADLRTTDEPSYHKPDSPTYIELHKYPFPSDSDAYGDCNRYFTHVFRDPGATVKTRIQDVDVLTLAPTEHVLFLMLHSYKHFLHSGFGIRQIMDLAVFTHAHQGEIRWEPILSALQELRCLRFAAAMYRISWRHLGFALPEPFQAIETDELPLLADVLQSGVHGAESLDRLHSSTITLSAVSGQKTGQGSAKGVFAATFLPLDAMKGKYPYLEKHPWLLPVAWGERIITYIGKRGKDHTDPAVSLKLGQERVALLRRYGIIE